jgi:hypothetical protein
MGLLEKASARRSESGTGLLFRAQHLPQYDAEQKKNSTGRNRRKTVSR